MTSNRPLCWLLLLAPALAAAQQIPSVTIAGSAGTALRRDDTAGRIVVGREELLRYGDGTLAAALGRQAGVSVSGGAVRMRGLAAGYTQILVNGDPVPAGFSLDSLSPELVERIEILRTTSAEYSAQALAGSINIVLRKTVPRARRDVKLGLERDQGRTNPAATLQLADRDDGGSWLVAGTVSRTGYTSSPQVTERGDAKSAGAAPSLRVFDEDYGATFRKASLAPRVSRTLAGGDTLAWQGLVDVTDTSNRGSAAETTLLGAPSRSPLSHWTSTTRTDVLRSDLAWTHAVGAGELTAKFAVNSSRRRGDYLFEGSDRRGAPTLVRSVLSSARDDGAGSSGKLLLPLLPGHAFAAGWDVGHTRRRETRLQQDSMPVAALDQDYTAGVTRAAVFVQDEWEIRPGLQAYLGLRWEGLRTATHGRTLLEATTRSGVPSPVFQALWKIPGRGQWRLALARTYKAPATRDLVPRRYTVNNDNGPGNPDIEGNPALRPELAWGIDGGWEAYFAGKGVVGITAYARRIDDVTVQRLYQDGATWVSTPSNAGRATAQGLEFDARLPLASVLAGAPALDLHANASRHWSRIDAVPGPGNRLDGQVPLTANLGADYRAGTAWSGGANFTYQGGATSRTSVLLATQASPVRTLDLYMAWDGGPAGKLRVALANLLHQPAVARRVYTGDDGGTVRSTVTPGTTAVRVQYEVALSGR